MSYTNEAKNSTFYRTDGLMRGTVFFVSDAEDFYLVGEDEDLFLIAQVWTDTAYSLEIKNIG